MGNRQRSWRTQGGRAFTWDVGRFRLASERGAQTRNGNCTRFRDQLLAGSSLREGASRLVLQTPGRHDQICGEPAKKVRRYLSVEFSLRKLARALGGAEKRSAVLGPAWSAHLSCGQSPHQTSRFLGVS